MEPDKKRDSKKIPKPIRRNESQETEEQEAISPSPLKNTAKRFKLERKNQTGETSATHENSPAPNGDSHLPEETVREDIKVEKTRGDAASTGKTLPFAPLVFENQPVAFEEEEEELLSSKPLETPPARDKITGNRGGDRGNQEAKSAKQPLFLSPQQKNMLASMVDKYPAEEDPATLPNASVATPGTPMVTPNAPVTTPSSGPALPASAIPPTVPVPKSIQVWQQPLFTQNKTGDKKITPVTQPSQIAQAKETLFPKNLGGQKTAGVGIVQPDKQIGKKPAFRTLLWLLPLLLLAAGGVVYTVSPDWCYAVLWGNSDKQEPDTPPVGPKNEYSKGWFAEKLPDGMILSKAKGDYLWTQDNSIMVYIPESPYWRGDDQLGNETEKPMKQIMISAFYLDKYELTNGQYLQFMNATGHAESPYLAKIQFNELRQPVVGIDWQDAQDYATWAHKRLPSEAEWEKAARGGLEIPDWHNMSDDTIRLTNNPLLKRRYPWGSETLNAKRANSSVPQDGYVYAAPVGSFPDGVSPYGCYDMAGNVWEWCNDSYQPKYYQTSPFKDPLAAASQTKDKKVCRGGSWRNGAEELFTFRRHYFAPTERQAYLGVRLAH
jgi:formylglycine-generating enzyme required for sulfatase activity